VWIHNKNRAAINTTEFINERLVVIEKDLGTVEESLKDYKASNNLTGIKAAGQTYLQESSLYAAKSFELNNQLSIAKYIREYLTDPTNNNALIPSNLGLTSNSVEKQITAPPSIIHSRTISKAYDGSLNISLPSIGRLIELSPIDAWIIMSLSSVLAFSIKVSGSLRTFPVLIDVTHDISLWFERSLTVSPHPK
jgi:hypothetical protein